MHVCQICYTEIYYLVKLSVDTFSDKKTELNFIESQYLPVLSMLYLGLYSAKVQHNLNLLIKNCGK